MLKIKKRSIRYGLKWFAITNLVCLSLFNFPFLLQMWITHFLHFKTNIPSWSIEESLPYILPVSLMCSFLAAWFSYKKQKEHGIPDTQKKPKTFWQGLIFFTVFVLSLYGLLTIVVIGVALTATDASLFGVIYFPATPIFFIISLITTCFYLKNIKEIILFLLITAVPLGSYQSFISYTKKQYYRDVFVMQKGAPTEEDWRDFFDKYQNNFVITKGLHNQLDLVLFLGSIPEDILVRYVDHPDHTIRWAVAKNPSLPLKYMYQYLETDDYLIRERLAQNPSLPSDVIEKLLQDKNAMVKKSIKETLEKKYNRTNVTN